MSEWISVKDAVPPDSRKVLINYKIKDEKYPPMIEIGWRIVYKNGKIKWKFRDCFGNSILCIEGVKGFYELLHWMPLPQSPEAE